MKKRILKILRKWKFAVALSVILGVFYSCNVMIYRKQPPSHALLSKTAFQPAGQSIRVLIQRLSGEKKLLFRCSDKGAIRGTISSPEKKEFAAREISSVEFNRGTVKLVFCDTKDFHNSEETGGSLLLSPDDPREQIEVCDSSIPNKLIPLFTVPGTLELIPETDAAYLINEVDFESYVLGVVGQESIHSFDKEAYRAQAIASRTYALYHWLRKKGDKCGKWHLTGTTNHQKYGSPADANSRMKEAVSETCGYVLTYRGDVFQAYFSSTCGGNTTPVYNYYNEPKIPPLSGNTCTYCAEEAPSDYVQWDESYSRKTVQKELKAYFLSRNRNIGTVERILPVGKGGDIYPVSFTVEHTHGKVTMSSLALKSLFKLKSQAVTSCVVLKDEVLFRGHGFGHGFGMCQYGSNGMAKAGKDFSKILYHYYPEAVLTKVWRKQELSAAAALPAK